MVWHSPFDLQYWFVNVLAGDMTMFLAIAFLVIAVMAGMFRMPTIITGVMFALFIILLAVETQTLILLVILVIAVVVGWSIARYFK